MLQSTAKGATAEKRAEKQTEARPATQAFVTEPLKPQLIAVGDVAHKNAGRRHDATLVGLAPPPVHAPWLDTQPLARPPQRKPLVASRDHRTLAAILVVGTLIAMFSIAFSAVPEASPTVPHGKAAQDGKVAPPPAERLPPESGGALEAPKVVAGTPSSSPQTRVVASAQPRVTAPKAFKPAAARSPVSRVRASTKAEPRTATRRRIKAD
jgi:hypothetical protein